MRDSQLEEIEDLNKAVALRDIQVGHGLASSSCTYTFALYVNLVGIQSKPYTYSRRLRWSMECTD